MMQHSKQDETGDHWRWSNTIYRDIERPSTIFWTNNRFYTRKSRDRHV